MRRLERRREEIHHRARHVAAAPVVWTRGATVAIGSDSTQPRDHQLFLVFDHRDRRSEMNERRISGKQFLDLRMVARDVLKPVRKLFIE
jgi:hypothetical protein